GADVRGPMGHLACIPMPQGQGPSAGALDKAWAAAPRCAAGGAGMICPKCGTNNPDNARFCIECGQPLSLPITCPVCGAVNPAGARFCNQRGSPLPGSLAAEGARQSIPATQSAVSAPAASAAPAPTPAPPPASPPGRTTRTRPGGGSATVGTTRGPRQPAA